MVRMWAAVVLMVFGCVSSEVGAAPPVVAEEDCPRVRTREDYERNLARWRDARSICARYKADARARCEVDTARLFGMAPGSTCFARFR